MTLLGKEKLSHVSWTDSLQTAGPASHKLKLEFCNVQHMIDDCIRPTGIVKSTQ